MRTIYAYGLNRGFGSKFQEGYLVQQTPDEGQGVQHLKHCKYNNKDQYIHLNVKAYNNEYLNCFLIIYSN